MSDQARKAMIAIVTLCILLCGGALYAQEIGEVKLDEINVVDDQDVPDGFKELRASGKSLVGVYEFEGARITFETRRGPLTPKILHLGRNTPIYEIDVRFLDEMGVPFLVQLGGHGPIDKSWKGAGDIIDNNDSLTEGDRAGYVRNRLRASVKAIEAMQSVHVNKRLTPEYDAIINLLPLLKSMDMTEGIEEGKSPHVSARKSGCDYRHRVEIHDQPCCFGAGRHSATITKNIDSGGTTTLALVTCNHGACASSMPLYCQWTTAPDRCPLYTTTECQSDYVATSTFGGHNCNDDTYIQYQRVREAVSPNPFVGTCSDSYSRMTTPACY